MLAGVTAPHIDGMRCRAAHCRHVDQPESPLSPADTATGVRRRWRPRARSIPGRMLLRRAVRRSVDLDVTERIVVFGGGDQLDQPAKRRFRYRRGARRQHRSGPEHLVRQGVRLDRVGRDGRRRLDRRGLLAPFRRIRRPRQPGPVPTVGPCADRQHHEVVHGYRGVAVGRSGHHRARRHGGVFRPRGWPTANRSRCRTCSQ
jgi:hypothetical protein